MRTIDRQVLSLLHRILARVLPEDANDVDGDLEYQLKRAKILEEGFAGEYWLEVAGFSTELSKRDCGRVSDILQMFRIITFSIDHLQNDGTPGATPTRGCSTLTCGCWPSTAVSWTAASAGSIGTTTS